MTLQHPPTQEVSAASFIFVLGISLSSRIVSLLCESKAVRRSEQAWTLFLASHIHVQHRHFQIFFMTLSNTSQHM